MTLYDRIKSLCEANGFAISYLADHVPDLEIKPSSINAWKNGSVPRRRILNSIADYFGVTPDYLLHGNEKTIVTGDRNIVGNNNTVTTCSEQEQAILEIFKALDIYKQAELLLYAKKLQQESEQ